MAASAAAVNDGGAERATWPQNTVDVSMCVPPPAELFRQNTHIVRNHRRNARRMLCKTSEIPFLAP